MVEPVVPSQRPDLTTKPIGATHSWIWQSVFASIPKVDKGLLADLPAAKPVNEPLFQGFIRFAGTTI